MSEETTTAPTETVEATTDEVAISYVDGKFDSVSALETSYKELQSSYSKKLGGFDGSPEDGYKYS